MRGRPASSGTCSLPASASAGSDWRDPEIWAYVNPALGVFRSLEEMQTSAKRAEHVPAQQAAFRQLYLNEWRDGSATPWINLAIWDQGQRELRLEDIDPGEPCWIGVDLASTADLAAVVAVFEHDEGYVALPRFSCPAEGIRRRSERDEVPYALWSEQGYLTATRGSVIDYEVIVADIVDLAERYRATVVLDR
jgi:phage terminase large subunit-like protein